MTNAFGSRRLAPCPRAGGVRAAPGGSAVHAWSPPIAEPPAPGHSGSGPPRIFCLRASASPVAYTNPSRGGRDPCPLASYIPVSRAPNPRVQAPPSNFFTNVFLEQYNPQLPIQAGRAKADRQGLGHLNEQTSAAQRARSFTVKWSNLERAPKTPAAAKPPPPVGRLRWDARASRRQDPPSRFLKLYIPTEVPSNTARPAANPERVIQGSRR